MYSPYHCVCYVKSRVWLPFVTLILNPDSFRGKPSLCFSYMLVRLAQKSLQTCPSSWSTRNLVLRCGPKSGLAARPRTPITPRPLVRYTSNVSPPTTWVDRLPASMRPYMYLTRIDKPIGTLLLFYPCGTSFHAGVVGTVPAECAQHQRGLSPWPPTRSKPRSRPRQHTSVYSASEPS